MLDNELNELITKTDLIPHKKYERFELPLTPNIHDGVSVWINKRIHLEYHF